MPWIYYSMPLHLHLKHYVVSFLLRYIQVVLCFNYLWREEIWHGGHILRWLLYLLQLLFWLISLLFGHLNDNISYLSLNQAFVPCQSSDSLCELVIVEFIYINSSLTEDLSIAGHHSWSMHFNSCSLPKQKSTTDLDVTNIHTGPVPPKTNSPNIQSGRSIRMSPLMWASDKAS